MSDRALKRLLVAAAAVAAFAPALTAGFVGWDENALIVDNPAIRGLDLEHLGMIARAATGGVWIPLTWLMFAVEHALWGFEPAGWHLTNLLLHAAAAVLFYEVCVVLLKEDSGAPFAPVLAALFFAVHPLRVESVAWVSEQKGLLAGALWLAALLAHLKGEKSRRPRLLRFAALAAFALSLAAKPNGLTFPLVLLAADLTRRRKPDVKVYVPYFILSGAAFAVTAWASRQTGAPAAFEPPGVLWGAGQALYGLLFYPWKTLWPSGLAAYYPPRPWFGSWSWALLGCAAAVAAACALLRMIRSRAAAGLAACYALALLPTLGLVSHGVPYSAADRFSYLPCLALALAFGASLLARHRAGLALAAVWLAGIGTLSWRQSAVWSDPVTLWSVTALRSPSALADGNLGVALVHEGRISEGIALLRASVGSDPGRPLPHEALGAALSRAGREDEARAAWRAGLAAAPSPELAAFLGASLIKDDVKTATALLRSAVSAKPDRASWRVDLGDALAHGGRGSEAKREYAAALDLEPGLGRGHNNLGLLLEREGRTEEAVARYRAALRDPGARAEANHNRGNVFLAAGRVQEAEARYREALRLDPGLSRSGINLGNILARRGAYEEAVALYRAALKTDPRSVEAPANLRAVLPRAKRAKR